MSKSWSRGCDSMTQQKLCDALSDEEYRVEALHSTIHAKNSKN
jgi:hypothetical protein